MENVDLQQLLLFLGSLALSLADCHLYFVKAQYKKIAGRRLQIIAANLSHGVQRQLEIAMVLATEPQVLLLDEPLAGMGAAEAEAMVALLHKLKKDHAMLLVEHDMDAVFALADVLTVMVNGTVIATGTPETIRGDAKVQAAYLGEATA